MEERPSRVEDELTITSRIDLQAIRQTKIHATITLTFEQWIEFERSMKKSGGKLGIGICEQVAPSLQKMRDVLAVLKA